jgi:hypothetical protein
MPAASRCIRQPSRRLMAARLRAHPGSTPWRTRRSPRLTVYTVLDPDHPRFNPITIDAACRPLVELGETPG